MFTIDEYREAFKVEEKDEKEYTVADMRNQFVGFTEKVTNAINEVNTLNDKIKAHEQYIAKLEERNRYLFNHQTIIENEDKDDKKEDDKKKSIDDVAKLYIK